MTAGKTYCGFELGPIRPPSEAQSLLLRVTRNCPWNRCKFCGVYKGEGFSVRPKEHVLKDIDEVKRCTDLLLSLEKAPENERSDRLRALGGEFCEEALHTAWNWYKSGMESVFLQDANTLVVKPGDLADIISYIREQFPQVERITSYARAETVVRISDEDMLRLAEAGLNRVHIGMETGADEVLKLVDKGTTKANQIIAGQRVKRAGIQLSEYFMPGLGGNEYSELNALETADALNQINPDYIRIRTLAVTTRSPLIEDYKRGVFTRTNDTRMVEELLLMIQNLSGITSVVMSDHILNLIPEVQGRLPEDKDKMIAAMRWYLDLPEDEKIIFRIGRRTGWMNMMSDLSDPAKRRHVQDTIRRHGIDASNIDEVTDGLMDRFI